MKAPVSTKTGNASSTKVNANSNQQIGLSATTATSSTNSYDHKTFIKILYGDNKMLIVNSLCTCLHMMNHVKEKLMLSRDETIDFMDFEGSIKEMPNLNNKDYAINYLTPTTNYTVLKIEFDPNTNEKRFVPLINESRLNPNMNKTVNNLNTGKAVTSKDKVKQTVNTRLKQQMQQQSQQNLAQQQTLNSNTAPSSASSLQPTSSATAIARKNSKKL